MPHNEPFVAVRHQCASWILSNGSCASWVCVESGRSNDISYGNPDALLRGIYG